MTRLDLENAVGRRLNKNTSSWDTATQTRIRHFLNQRHRRLLSIPGLTPFRYGQSSFASVASQSRYALPFVGPIQRMWQTTNDYMLLPMDVSLYRQLNPDPTSNTGTPTHYVFLGYEPVAKQPSNDSELFVKSTAAGDTTQTAYVEGIVTGGTPASRSVTLTGTTAVTLGAGYAFSHVTKFYLSATGAGAITLHEDSGAGTEMAAIQIGQTTQKYLVFHLNPCPSGVVTYYVEHDLASTDFGADGDEPRLPEQWHFLLELGATLDEMVKGDDSRYAVVKTEYDDGVRDLQYWIARQSERSTQAPRYSTLGAWYPADR